MRLPYMSVKFIIRWLDMEHYLARRGEYIRFANPR